jgi:outer membrane protein TolC
MMAFGSILNQRAFNFGLDFNHPGKIDNLNATGAVAYNLYSGGRATAGRNAAKAGARAAEQDLRATQNQLGVEVVKSYLNIRKAREAVAAVEAGVKAYEAGVAAARARFEAGQMLKADLLNLEVQLAQTRETLSSVRHGAALAARAFLFVLGQEASGETVELAADDPSVVRLSLPDLHDYSQRPELLGLQERIRAAEAMVRAARGSRQPTVNAFASYQYDQGWKLDRHGDGWMAGVSVDLNVFDGGQTSGKIRQSTAELAQVKEMLRKATLGIGLEVEKARLAREDAVERLAVTAQAVEQAEESAALSRARFEKGALLAADLIGVESRLIETRMRRAVAGADERIALAELRSALGLTPLAQPSSEM